MVPCVPGVFSGRMSTARGSPSRFPPSDTPRTALEDQFRSAAATVDNVGTGLAHTWHSSDSSKSHVLLTWHHSELTQGGSMHEYAATRRKRLDRYHPTGLCDVKSRRGVFSAVCAYLRLLHSVPTVSHRGGCKPELVIHCGSRCARCVFPDSWTRPEGGLGATALRTCHPWHSRSS